MNYTGSLNCSYIDLDGYERTFFFLQLFMFLCITAWMIIVNTSGKEFKVFVPCVFLIERVDCYIYLFHLEDV